MLQYITHDVSMPSTLNYLEALQPKHELMVRWPAWTCLSGTVWMLLMFIDFCKII